MTYSDLPTTHYDLLNLLNASDLKKLMKICINELKKLNNSLLYNQNILPTTKHEIIKHILSMLDERSLENIFKILTNNQKNTIIEIVYNSGIINLESYQSKYNSRPSIPKHNFWFFSAKYEDKIFVEKECSLSLFYFFVSTKGSIPEDLRTKLMKFIPKPKNTTIRYVSSELENNKDKKIHLMEESALYELQFLLNSINDGKIRVSSKTGIITESSAIYLKKSFLSKDYYQIDINNKYDVQIGKRGIKPFAWVLLLQSANLVKIKGTKLILDGSADVLLSRPSHEIIKFIWEKYLLNNNFHELNRVEIIKGQKSKSKNLYQASSARIIISNVLKNLELGKWVKTSDFFSYILSTGVGFNIAKNPWGLYITHPEYGSLGYDHIKWEHINGTFTLCFLLEYAATLGIIDVYLEKPWNSRDFGFFYGLDDYSALSRYDGLLGFRLTRLGQYVLGLADQFKMKKDNKFFRILANFEIVIVSKGQYLNEYLISKFADKTSDNVFKLSKTKILNALENGTDWTFILDFFKSYSETQIPQNVLSFFNDISNKPGQLEVVDLVYLVNCKNNSLVKLIINDPNMKKYCQKFNNNSIIFPKKYENTFKKDIKKAGYFLPKITSF